MVRRKKPSAYLECSVCVKRELKGGRAGAPDDLQAMVAEFAHDKVYVVVEGDADGMIELAVAAQRLGCNGCA
jgi:hypothetical protein